MILRSSGPPSVTTPILTPRWTPLLSHPVQSRLWWCGKRFRVVPAGRRSGKTELAKRFLILQALSTNRPNARFFFCAPTTEQAKKIYWDDVKAMVPARLVRKVQESDPQELILVNGARIIVVGLDRPQRIEGGVIDGIVLDEYADMRATAWDNHIRPGLATLGRPGWAWLIGVPEGRNHYYKLWKKAISQAKGWEDWAGFTWRSADILPASEIEAARNTTDPTTFRQEYEASFESYTGRAYCEFDVAVHAIERLAYIPGLPLNLCFDFNVSPGIAVVTQEQPYTGTRAEITPLITAVIGEVHIPRNSTTRAVTRRLIEDWKDVHTGEVRLFGDATGGARGTAQTEGSDWDIIKRELRQATQWDVTDMVPSSNPAEKARVNAMNTRFRTESGRVSMLLDPDRAHYTAEDCDAVVRLEGGSGEIDKKATPDHTHLTDALGYYVEAMHSIDPFEREKGGFRRW